MFLAFRQPSPPRPRTWQLVYFVDVDSTCLLESRTKQRVYLVTLVRVVLRGLVRDRRTEIGFGVRSTRGRSLKRQQQQRPWRAVSLFRVVGISVVAASRSPTPFLYSAPPAGKLQAQDGLVLRAVRCLR